MADRTSTSRVLDRASSVLALSVVVAAPVALGSVHTVTLLVLSIAALLSLTLAGFAGPLRIGRSSLAFGVLSLWPAVQLIPLPPGLLELVAPQTAEVVRAALGPDAGWRPITLDLPATARELVRALGLAALFATLRHHASTPGFRRRLLSTIGATGALLAAAGFAHLAVGVSSLLFLWKPIVATTLPLPFGNANHAAGILNASALVALGMAASPKTRRPRWWGAGVVAAFAASVAQGSRGGVIAGITGLVVATVGIAILRRRARTLAGVVAAILVAGALVLAVDTDAADAARAVASPSLLEDGKLVPVHAALAAFSRQPWTGIGRGAFETVHPLHLSGPSRVTYTHVENEVIQALVELGGPVAIALILCLAIAIVLLAREARRSITEIAAFAAAIALLLQSFGDFGLHFAGGFWLVALVATPVSAPPLTSRLQTVLLTSATALALVASSFALPDLQASTRTLEALAADRTRSLDEVESAITAALERRPADHVACLVGAARALNDGQPHRTLAWANRALLLAPHSGAANRLAGRAFASLGRRSQALGQYRLAMEKGVTTTRDVLRHYPDSEAVLAATPTTSRAAFDAAWVLYDAGRYDEGLEVLRRAPAPDTHAHHYLLGTLAQRAGRLDLATASARRLREIAPDHPDGWLLEAAVLRSRGRYDELRALLADARRHHPWNLSVELAAAQAELAAGDVEAAWRTLQDAPSSLNRNLLADRHALRAAVHRRRNELRRAREEMQQAVELSPHREDYRDELQKLTAETEERVPLDDRNPLDVLLR